MADYTPFLDRSPDEQEIILNSLKDDLIESGYKGNFDCLNDEDFVNNYIKNDMKLVK